MMVSIIEGDSLGKDLIQSSLKEVSSEERKKISPEEEMAMGMARKLWVLLRKERKESFKQLVEQGNNGDIQKKLNKYSITDKVDIDMLRLALVKINKLMKGIAKTRAKSKAYGEVVNAEKTKRIDTEQAEIEQQLIEEQIKEGIEAGLEPKKPFVDENQQKIEF